MKIIHPGSVVAKGLLRKRYYLVSPYEVRRLKVKPPVGDKETQDIDLVFEEITGKGRSLITKLKQKLQGAKDAIQKS